MATRIEIATRYIKAFETLDGNEFRRLKTPDCQHYFAPASIGIDGSKGNAEFADHMVMLQGVLKGFPVFIKEMWDGGNSVTIWATSETQFLEQAKDEQIEPDRWAFRGEYIFILDFEGEQISRVVEFLDSKATDELRVLMKRARRNLGLDEQHI